MIHLLWESNPGPWDFFIFLFWDWEPSVLDDCAISSPSSTLYPMNNYKTPHKSSDTLWPRSKNLMKMFQFKGDKPVNFWWTSNYPCGRTKIAAGRTTQNTATCSSVPVTPKVEKTLVRYLICKSSRNLANLFGNTFCEFFLRLWERYLEMIWWPHYWSVTRCQLCVTLKLNSKYLTWLKLFVKLLAD